MATQACEAVKARKQLIEELELIAEPFKTDPIKGTEEELLRVFNVLEGIVAEFTDGGDEMAEGCTCDTTDGPSDHVVGHKGKTFQEIYAKYKEARTNGGN